MNETVERNNKKKEKIAAYNCQESREMRENETSETIKMKRKKNENSLPIELINWLCIDFQL